jgi:hypothetical protein
LPVRDPQACRDGPGAKGRRLRTIGNGKLELEARADRTIGERIDIDRQDDAS